MERAIIEQQLLEIMEENGILVDEKELPLQDYLPDSLVFVNIIIGIEERFDIELPEEMLLIENFGTLSDFVERLEDLINSKELS